MFDFRPYDMPSMFSNPMRYNSNNTFSRRGDDIWNLFEDDCQPFFNQRRVVNKRRSPLYDDDDYITAERPNVTYRAPYKTSNNSPYPTYEAQPNRYQYSNTCTNKSEKAYNKTPQSTSQLVDNSRKLSSKTISFSVLNNYVHTLMATFIRMLLAVVSIINSVPNKITAKYQRLANSKSEAKPVSSKNEKKTEKPVQVEAKPYKAPEVHQQEAQQPKPEPVKAKKVVTQQFVSKTQKVQDKRDLVIIEDVTPCRPNIRPENEPKKGLVIEEVNQI